MITILDDTMCIVDILRKYEYSQYEAMLKLQDTP